MQSPRCLALALAVCLIAPALAAAQTPSDAAISASARTLVAPAPVTALEISRPRPAALVPLYVSLASLQAADTALTLRGVGRGAVESNPAVAGLTRSPLGFVAMKAGVTALSIVAAEGLRKRHPIAAVVLLSAVNSAYAAVVVHNYRVTR